MGHVFDPDELHELGKRVVGLPFVDMVERLIGDVAAAYPGHVETKQDWLFSLAGGAKGVMTILHGSLTEYVIVFGAPIGTEGFSGRYRIDIHDTVLAGEMSTYTLDTLGAPVVSRPGDRTLLAKGTVKGFKLSAGCWMLEYGRGPVPTSLPVALGDALFSAQDAPTIAKTFWNYGKLIIRELRAGKI